MLVGNQSCTVPQRTLQNKNNPLNYECVRPDRQSIYITAHYMPYYMW
jgi:hypothetical protein